MTFLYILKHKTLLIGFPECNMKKFDDLCWNKRDKTTLITSLGKLFWICHSLIDLTNKIKRLYPRVILDQQMYLYRYMPITMEVMLTRMLLVYCSNKKGLSLSYIWMKLYITIVAVIKGWKNYWENHATQNKTFIKKKNTDKLQLGFKNRGWTFI